MSLRTRLILTHIFIILFTLAILAVSLAFVLRDYQRQVQLSRLGDAVVPLSFQARAMVQNDVPPREILARLQPQAGDVGTVMLVTDKGLVLADANYNLTNRTLTLTPLERAQATKGFFWGMTQARALGRQLLYAAVSAGQLRGQNVYIALAAPDRGFFTVLDEIGVSLLFAGSATLLVSLLVALLLARSIAGPLSRLTHATEAIARGQYAHRVPGQGGDELGRLATSFNSMAEQVQNARQMEKDFVANVSHELKTPLTSIQGFAQAILDGAVPDMTGAQRAAQTIYDETARMARLVGDLLTIARLESGQMELARESINLQDALPNWVERLRPRANSATVALVIVVDALPPIIGDPGRLEQVVTNLVDNAIKYNRPDGSVTVTVRVESEPSIVGSSVFRRRTPPPAPKHWVALAVSDTGFGIPPEDLSRLFERFYRGDKARVAGGTGLGLAIAREIILAHGGKISVTSEVGRGTTFTVQLPVA